MNFRREFFIGVMLTFLIASMFILTFHVFPVKSTEWTVDDDGPADFHSIQDALNNASSGDSIYVYNGTYHEAVVIDETLDALTLTGENRSNTIINGTGFQYLGPLVTILANNVTVSGFTVTNARKEGITVSDSQFCSIHDNIVCFTGDRTIVLGGGGNHLVYNNIVYNSSSNYGGIEALWSDHNLIFGNIVYFNQWGIATNHGSYNEIFDNVVFSNRETGIHIDWPSTDNIIQNNNITLNLQAGIRVLNQANLTMISHNTISRSNTGIHLEDSFANTISENYIIENLDGMILTPSENNSIHHNSFMENIQQVLAYPSYYNIWDDGYPSGGNYWSDYTGTDLYRGPYQNETGRDGIGDTPYIINMNNTDRYPLMGIRNYEDRVTQVVSTESMGDSNSASLAVDPNGIIHVAWHDQPDLASGLYDIFYRRFEPDFGWSFTEIVSTESTANSLNPSLAIDPNGNIHIAWQDQTNLECGTDWDIFYKRYEAGTGWTSTEVVSTESTANSLNPSLAIDPNGNIHIAWQDQTNLECGTDWDIFYKGYQLGGGLGQNVQELPWNVDPDYMESARDSNVLYEKELQGSWTSTEVVSTESTANSLRPSLAADPNGNIHIAWDDTTDYAGSGSDPDIFYKRYEIIPSGGWTTTEVVSIESTLASYDSSLDVDFRGRVHIAWEDQTDLGCGSDWDIFYKKLLAGVNWTSTEVVSTESTEVSLYPSLAADLAGNVYVAWCDNTSYTGSGSDWDIFFKIWEVRTSWTTTEVVSTESSDDSWYPSLAVDMMKNVHIAWTDYSDYAGSGDDPDIFYKYIRLHSTRYPWSMFRHNPRRTGYIESPAPVINRTQWTYTTGGNVRSSPAVIDGIVYVGSNDGSIYALDQHTGAQIWNKTIGLSVSSSPAVAYSRVYVGSSDAKVYCLDALTGTYIWNKTTGAYVASSPAVVDGKVYIGSGYGEGQGIVYCLDALTGTQIWNQTTGSYVDSSPAVASNRVYVGSGGKVYCLDALTGTRVWNQTVGANAASSPAVVDGKVYIGSGDGKVYCLDALTGTRVWNQTVGANAASSPAVVDGKVYIGSGYGEGQGIVYCLDALTGTQIWNQTTSDYIESSPAVADGKVYIGSDDYKVYCLDALTGTYIWNYTTGGYVESSPAVADGMVFVGSYDHVVYAFGIIIRVPEDYPTVQGAIDAAEGTTILVAPGVYHETLVINKTLTIIGRLGSVPVFDGGGSGIAVILLSGASGSTVAGIVITNYDQGILMVDSGNCKIFDNVMSLMEYSGIALDGSNAINNQIYSNIIQENNIAIDLIESSTSNTIYKNIIVTNDVAINLESGGNTIFGNTLIGNEVGINVTTSQNNIIYHNNFINNVMEDTLCGGTTNVWDNGYPSGGNYWSTFIGVDLNHGPDQDVPGSDGIFDSNYTIAGNNVDNYPLAQPFNPHDLGITGVYKSKNVIGQGYTLSIEIRVLNYGIYDEAFTLTVYSDSTSLTSQAATLTKRNSTTIIFEWDTSTSPKGNYTISAIITILPDEIFIDDNTFLDGWIIVAMVADITGPTGWPDGVCDMRDIGAVARLFGKEHTDPEYNPDFDIVYDLTIDMRDIGTVARHFGETDP